MKFASVAILAVLALAVFASDPVLPKGKLCSIQGSGSVRFASDGIKLSGSFTMKRVNETSIFNVQVYETQYSSKAVGGLLNRPDLNNCYFDVHSESTSTPLQIDAHGRSNPAFSFSSYEYDPDTTKFEGKDCYTFSFGMLKSVFVSIYFSRDKKMELLGEKYYDFGDDGVTFVYDSVSDYQHDTVDGTFSMSSRQYPEMSHNAEYALSSGCKGSGGGSASVVFPSLALLLLLAAALAILF